MSKTKYGQYVIQNPINYDAPYGADVSYTGEKDFKNNFTEIFVRITRDMVMEEYAHTHDFDMYVWVLPLDPDNMDDLGAEVEMTFGEEAEKHIVTKTACFYVPKGLIHAPFIFRNVTKPILFIHSMMAPNYYKSEIFK